MTLSLFRAIEVGLFWMCGVEMKAIPCGGSAPSREDLVD
jgi:hypothetical protein